jgi:hypothetical protein
MFEFDSHKATHVLFLKKPLDECLPFHAAVRNQLQRYGLAVVKPAFEDTLTLFQAADRAAFRAESYTRTYEMTFGCINRSEPVEIQPTQEVEDGAKKRRRRQDQDELRDAETEEKEDQIAKSEQTPAMPGVLIHRAGIRALVRQDTQAGAIAW